MTLKTCICGNGKPHYNYPEEKEGKYCRKCRLSDDMVD